MRKIESDFLALIIGIVSGAIFGWGLRGILNA